MGGRPHSASVSSEAPATADFDGRWASGFDPLPTHPAAALRSVLVEYPDRPDRRTVCPSGIERDELMVTWLTADAAAFVDLLEAR